MEELIKTTLLGLFFGTFGTTLGGIIGVKFNNTSKKFLSFVLSFASGLMIAVVCFDLLPEALEISTFTNTIFGIILGIFIVILCDVIINNKLTVKHKDKGNENYNLLKTGIIVSIGLALHNFPEGLAIGSGFEVSKNLGISLAIAIAIHDIPEGIFQSRHQ